MSVNGISYPRVSSVTRPEAPARERSHDNHSHWGNRPPARPYFSQRAELFSKLQELETKDNDSFKQVLTSIAGGLHEQAAEGGQGSGRLERIADRLDAAASSGQLRDLKPEWTDALAGPERHPGVGRMAPHRHHFGPRSGFGSAVPFGALGGLGATEDMISSALEQVDSALASLSIGAPTSAQEPVLSADADAANVEAGSETSEPSPTPPINPKTESEATPPINPKLELGAPIGDVTETETR